MIKTSQLTKDTYKPKDIAQFLGVTTRTLQNWDKDDNGLLFNDTIDKKRDIIYARVSSHDQKAHGDLDRQVQF